MKRGKNDDYYFLSRIIEKLLETDTYKKNAIHLMKYWCISGNQKQRTMVYSLYNENRDIMAASCIQDSMKDVIQKEISEGRVLYDETGKVADVIFLRTKNINFRTFQENGDAAVLFARAIMEIFNDCTQVQKRILGFYFCHIFLLDFFYEGYPRYQMMFIKLMQEKEMRKTIIPLYRYVWRKKVFRDVLEETLNHYLDQLWKKNQDWVYSKAFFREKRF